MLIIHGVYSRPRNAPSVDTVRVPGPWGPGTFESVRFLLPDLSIGYHLFGVLLTEIQIIYFRPHHGYRLVAVLDIPSPAFSIRSHSVAVLAPSSAYATPVSCTALPVLGITDYRAVVDTPLWLRKRAHHHALLNGS